MIRIAFNGTLAEFMKGMISPLILYKVALLISYYITVREFIMAI